MGESIKPDKVLTNRYGDSSDLKNFEIESETIRVLEDFCKKIELEYENVDCKSKDGCYVAKNNMGQCPCELYI